MSDATAINDVDERLHQAREVVNAGVVGFVGIKPVHLPYEVGSSNEQVIVATKGTLSAIGAEFDGGRFFTPVEESLGARVVVLGGLLASSLSLDGELLDNVVIDGVRFKVVGEVADTARESSILFSAIVPAATANDLWGALDSAVIVAYAEPGLARQATQAIPLAVSPTTPGSIEVAAPPDAATLGLGIDQRFQELIRLLSASLLVAGTAVIGGSTLISAMERRREFGIRRAIGWSRTQVAILLIAEAAAITWVATAIGASLALVGMTVLGRARDWALVIDWRSFWVAVTVGAVAGPLAGLWPGLRAARVNPIEAIRD